MCSDVKFYCSLISLYLLICTLTSSLILTSHLGEGEGGSFGFDREKSCLLGGSFLDLDQSMGCTKIPKISHCIKINPYTVL